MSMLRFFCCFLLLFNLIRARDNRVDIRLHLDSDNSGCFFAYSVEKTELHKNINVPDLLKRIKEGTIEKVDHYIDENVKVVSYDDIILCGATPLDVWGSIELSEDRNTLYTGKVMDKIHGLIDMYFLTKGLYDTLISLTIENIGFNLHNSSFEEGSKRSYKLNKKLVQILKGGFLTGSFDTCIKIALKKDRDVIDFLDRSKRETGATSEYHHVNAFTADRGDDPCNILYMLRNGIMQKGSKFDFCFYYEYEIKAKVQYFPPEGYSLRQREDGVNKYNGVYRRAVRSDFGDDIKFYEQIEVRFLKFQNVPEAIRSVLGDNVQNEIIVEELGKKIDEVDFKTEFRDNYTLNVICDPRSECVESYLFTVRIDLDKTMNDDTGNFKLTRPHYDLQICVRPEDIKTEEDFRNYISRQEFNGKKIPAEKILNVFKSEYDNNKRGYVSKEGFSTNFLKDSTKFNITLDKEYAINAGFISGVDGGEEEGKTSNTETSNLGNNHLKPISGPSCCACCACCGKCCHSKK